MRANLIPGGSIRDSKPHRCKGCKADVLLGLVRDAESTLKWRNFDLPAVEQGGLRYYRRHFCPMRQEQSHAPRLLQGGRR